MDYYIGICPAPCLLTQTSLDTHTENIDRFRDFFSGKSQSVLSLLEQQMKEKAKNLEFEKAQEIKESLVALRSLQERQIVRD
jgi:excinuclease ABC subunit C